MICLFPQEEIVRVWLEEKGFFTMTNIKVGAREIDLLAVNPITGEKIHVESHVSVKPVGRIRDRGHLRYSKLPLSERIKYIVDKKFKGKVGERVKEIFGTDDYNCLHVCGKINKDDPDEVSKEFEKNGVKAEFFETILKELIEILNSTGKA